MAAKQTLLIVDDDPEYRGVLKKELGRDYEVMEAGNVADALLKLNAAVDIALLDVRLLNEEDDRGGLELLASMRKSHPLVPIVMMSADRDVNFTLEARKLGASDFIHKAEVDLREFGQVLADALERADLERTNRNLEEQLRKREPWELVGDSAALNEVRRQIDLAAADGRVAVMIRGETGTGKGAVAKAIHRSGRRKRKPFVGVSIPQFPPELVPAELFGHARGAFTDAKAVRLGYIEESHGGVLFLDEIGELNQEAQRALLRFLDTRSFARIGSTAEIKVDIQIVCATNVDLEEAIDRHVFRKDLYYRLKQLEIFLPPLRERTEDVPLLVDHFLFLMRQEGRRRLAGVAPSAMAALRAYHYPGNIRELQNIVERASLWASADRRQVIEVADLPTEVTMASPPAAPQLPGEAEVELDLKRALDLTELRCAELALKRTDGRKGEASLLLGRNERRMTRRIQEIIRRNPDLLETHPLVRKLYGPSS